MTKEIEDFVNCYEACQSTDTESPQSLPPPTRPVNELALDLFDCKGASFVVIVDRYSRTGTLTQTPFSFGLASFDKGWSLMLSTLGPDASC